jgi:hypothetical protein
LDKIVKPILVYGCEVWGMGNNDIVERILQNSITCKKKKSTHGLMVYGELGRFPLEIYVTTSDYPLLVLITNRKTRKKIPVMFCNSSLLNNRTNIPWLKSVKSILDECGLLYVWTNIYFVSATWLYNTA